VKLWRGGGQRVAHSSERPYPQGSLTMTCAASLAVWDDGVTYEKTDHSLCPRCVS
jgi:hypothetical protein